MAISAVEWLAHPFERCRHLCSSGFGSRPGHCRTNVCIVSRGLFYGPVVVYDFRNTLALATYFGTRVTYLRKIVKCLLL